MLKVVLYSTGFQSVAVKSQASNKQELITPQESLVQTSVQTKSENDQKQAKAYQSCNQGISANT